MANSIIANYHECRVETEFIELPDKSRVRTKDLPIDLSLLEEQNSTLRFIFKCGIYFGIAGMLMQSLMGDFVFGVLGFIYTFLLFYPAKYYAERSANLLGVLMEIGGERPVELVLKTRTSFEALEQFRMLSLKYVPNSNIESIQQVKIEGAEFNDIRADLIERLRSENAVKLVA